MSTDRDDGPTAQRHIQAELAQTLRDLGLIEDASCSEGDGASDDGCPGPAKPDRRLREGMKIDRFVVLEWVGGGGQGDVYAAYDPRLDRRVALKLIRVSAEHGDRVQKSRLLREAQALAHLEHPNIVRVHDFGAFGTTAYLVMEYKANQTLARWLRAGRRWRDILARFVAAGRGLHAAHVKGIVHRDVKAENIFIDDHVGAVLGDFGFASGSEEDAALDSDRTISAIRQPPVLCAPLTADGRVPGTEGFIAPEALHGRATARSDQYSFCVAVFHALFGVMPGPDERRTPNRPGDNPPASLIRSLHRGLARDPEARYPDMAGLLVALEARPRRRAGLVVTAGLAALAAGAGIAWAQAPDPCVVGARVAAQEVWNAERRGDLAEAFAALRLPFAYQTGESFLRFADDYRTRWTEARVANCAAPVPAVETCLSRQLHRFDRLLTMYTAPDAQLVRHALDATARLDDPSECRDPAMPAQGDIPDELRRALDRVDLRIATGDFVAARAELDDLQRQAADDPAARPRALYLAGWLKAASAPDRTSDALLAEAMYAAALARDPDTFMRAATYRLKSLVVDLGEPVEAARVEREVESVAAQWPAETPAGRRFRADFLEARGARLDREGDHEAAAGEHRRALELRRELEGRDHPLVAKSHHNLAVSLASAGEAFYDEARGHYVEALRIRSEQLGEGHPETASSAFGLAHAECEHLASVAEHDPGVLSDCLRDLEAALDDYREHGAWDRRGVHRRAITLANLAIDAGCDDCAERALAAAEAAIAGLRDVDPREQSDLLAVRGKLADSRGAFSAARAAFVAGIRLWNEVHQRDESYFQHLGNAAAVAIEEGLGELAVFTLLAEKDVMAAAPCAERLAYADVLDAAADELSGPDRSTEKLRAVASSLRQSCEGKI